MRESRGWLYDSELWGERPWWPAYSALLEAANAYFNAGRYAWADGLVDEAIAWREWSLERERDLLPSPRLGRYVPDLGL
jgi:hypothetical protein